ncbi:MAG: hypothetical protein M3O67_07145 [Bacteroidota bacterium]|nr:hypothetical protein [Bacteroidota bacterium]
MSSSYDIQYLTHIDIDKKKWDDCIHNSTCPLIYAYSFYLDHLAANWHGIVLNDYEAVMPVPWRKKWGIRYCYDVPFIQQCGCFQPVTSNYTEIFLKTFFRFCRYGDYNFNYRFDSNIKELKTYTNYILDLSESYDSISKNYSGDLINNLKKANKETFTYSKEDHDTVIDLYKSLYHERILHVTDLDFENFRRLCYYLQTQNQMIIRKISNSNNDLLATALILKDKKRMYNLINSTTAEGRKTEANHFLFDNIFREFAASGLVFDFEGSDIPGVKSFYEKFGAFNQPYYKLHFNNLPFPLNILKR